MPAETLTSDRILIAAEDALRRYGPAKANVVDVARALGVSHGSVYRHFPSKAALRDAVTERWLASISEPLEAVANGKGPAPERLQRWLALLVSAKRSKALGDPELFATYIELTADARDVVKAHVDTLVAQLARIVAHGVTRGEFETTDPAATGRAIFDATARFHNPAHAPEWSNPASMPPSSASEVSSSMGSHVRGHGARDRVPPGPGRRALSLGHASPAPCASRHPALVGRPRHEPTE